MKIVDQSAPAKMAATSIDNTLSLPNGAVQVRVVGQYIKDVLFASPNIHKLLSGIQDNPNLKVEIDVNAAQLGRDVYETVIDFKANATAEIGIVYELEMMYGGVFKTEGVPEHQLDATLLVDCPMLLFPFMRRIVADLTREGGFPPLLLDPVDFGALYVRKRALAAQATQ